MSCPRPSQAVNELADRTRATLDPLAATGTSTDTATVAPVPPDDEEDDGLLNIATSNVKAAVALARQHYLSRAVERLMRSGGTIAEEDLVAQLQALHPPSTTFPASPPQPPQTFVALDVDDVRKALAKACSGKSPGPSGWTEELLRDACSLPVVAQAITAMLADIMAGNVSSTVRDLLTDCSLIGIPKRQVQHAFMQCCPQLAVPTLVTLQYNAPLLVAFLLSLFPSLVQAKPLGKGIFKFTNKKTRDVRRNHLAKLA